MTDRNDIFRMDHITYHEEGMPKPTVEEVQQSRSALLDRIQKLIYGEDLTAIGGTGCVDFRTSDDKLILIDDITEKDGERKFRLTIEKSCELGDDNVVVLSDDDSSLQNENLAFTNIVRDRILNRIIDSNVGRVEDAEALDSK
jgi:hypothetical protein